VFAFLNKRGSFVLGLKAGSVALKLETANGAGVFCLKCSKKQKLMFS
jgi:hypothetical protein